MRDICYEDSFNQIIADRFAETNEPPKEKKGRVVGDTSEMGRSRSDVVCFCGSEKEVYWWSASGHGFVKMPCGHALLWPSLKLLSKAEA